MDLLECACNSLYNWVVSKINHEREVCIHVTSNAVSNSEKMIHKYLS